MPLAPVPSIKEKIGNQTPFPARARLPTPLNGENSDFDLLIDRGRYTESQVEAKPQKLSLPSNKTGSVGISDPFGRAREDDDHLLGRDYTEVEKEEAMYFDPTGPAFVCMRVRVKYLHCAGPSRPPLLLLYVYVVDDDREGRNRSCPAVGNPAAASSLSLSLFFCAASSLGSNFFFLFFSGV